MSESVCDAAGAPLLQPYLPAMRREQEGEGGQVTACRQAAIRLPAGMAEQHGLQAGEQARAVASVGGGGGG